MTARHRSSRPNGSPKASPGVVPPPSASPRWFPPLHHLLHPKAPYLIPLLLLLVTRVLMWTQLGVGAEDAYITFRYARNLAVGNGLVYNPGSHVLGFSSPVWAIWNALGYRLLHDPLSWSRATAIVADLVTLIGLGGLIERHASRLSAWCFTFFFAVWPYFSAVAVSGMESSFLLALIVLSALAVEAKSLVSGPALATLALTRPEGLAAALLLGIGARGRDRVVAAALIALGLAGLAITFGTVVPQSVLAKVRLYGAPGPWAGRHWWEWLSPFPLGRWPQQGDTVHLTLLAIIMAPACVVALPRLWAIRRTGLALAIGATLLIWLGYVLVGVAYFWWYLLVPLAGLVALAAIGLPALIRGRGILVACVLFGLGIWTEVPRLYVTRSQEEVDSFGQVATYLETHARPGQKVMLEPIGLVGYHAPVIVVDEIGLVSPGVAKRRLEGPGWYTDTVDRERPDWLVLRVGVLKTGVAFAGAGAPFRSPAERDSLMAHYTMVAKGDEHAGDGALVVMQRSR